MSALPQSIPSTPREQALHPLRFGAIRPGGWLHTQIRRDLEQGFTGCLDRLVPELFSGDDIYGQDRLTAGSRRKDLGTTTEQDISEQQMWWNSETQSNWHDGLVRSALLIEHPASLQKTHAWVDHILEGQDADGYLGIYGPDLRYKFDGENGELWAQASLLRVLLAYHEATGRSAVLRAVERAVHCTLRAWPADGANPFQLQETVCGPEHGLVFTDVLDRLHFLTGNCEYLEYAEWLYRAFSNGNTTERDLALLQLMDSSMPFEGHAVHTFEHLRPLIMALRASGQRELQKALECALEKTRACLAPSGAPIGDEFILGRTADPGETGYEYCSIMELLDSWASLLQLSGDSHWADRMEWLLYNAAQGARSNDHRSMAYCTTDNACQMLGHLHMEQENNPPEMRFKYSPVHQDAAVCCAPNAGRVFPYFVQNMMQRQGSDLVVSLYGPMECDADAGGGRVHIRQETRYPFEHQVKFVVCVNSPLRFRLRLRVPGWAHAASVRGCTAEREGQYLVIDRDWSGETQFTVNFEARPGVSRHPAGEWFVHHGPLLYVLPMNGVEVAGRAWPVEGFQDRFYRANDSRYRRFSLDPNAVFRTCTGDEANPDPWLAATRLLGPMRDGAQDVELELLPMGATILRQATFPAPGPLKI